MELLLPLAIIGAISGLLTNGFNFWSNERSNKQNENLTRDINQQNIEASKQASATDYNRNSLSNQVAQMRQAGLNPQLMNGTSFQPSSSSAPELKTPSMRSAHFSNPVSDAVDTYTSALSTISNSNVNEAQALKLQEETAKTKSEREGIDIRNKNLQESIDRENELKAAQAAKLRAETSIIPTIDLLNKSKIKLNDAQISQIETNCNLLTSEISLNSARYNLTEAQTKEVYNRINLANQMSSAQIQEIYSRIQRNEDYHDLLPSIKSHYEAQIKLLSAEEQEAIANTSLIQQEFEHEKNQDLADAIIKSVLGLGGVAVSALVLKGKKVPIKR